MSKELQRRVEKLSRTVDHLVIVERKIIGDLCAVFSLRGPPNSMIGLTCVSVLPCQRVAVVGDLCTAVFATYGSSNWKGAISRFYSPDHGCSWNYIREKASTGMSGFQVEEYSSGEAKEDLGRVFLDDDSNSPDDRLYDEGERRYLLSVAENNNHLLYSRMSEIDSDFNDGGLPGMVLNENIIAGALVMNHLSMLLSKDEA